MKIIYINEIEEKVNCQICSNRLIIAKMGKFDDDDVDYDDNRKIKSRRKPDNNVYIFWFLYI